MKLNYSLSSCIKTNSKWIRDLNTGPERMNYVEESIGTKLMGLGLREGFVNLTLKIREVKGRINEWDDVKLKIFCTAKETKRQPAKWEVTVANNSPGKGLTSKPHKELTQLSTKQTYENRAGNLDRHLSQDDIRMANRFGKDHQLHCL